MLGVDIIIVDLYIVEPIPVGLKAVEVNAVDANPCRSNKFCSTLRSFICLKRVTWHSSAA